eukprot:3527638-Prymnesium_polylepis.1
MDTWGRVGDIVGPPNHLSGVLHEEPERKAWVFRLTFDIFTSRCWQAHQHEALAERSSNLTLQFNLDYGEVRSLSLKIEPAFAVSTLWRFRTRLRAVGEEGS